MNNILVPVSSYIDALTTENDMLKSMVGQLSGDVVALNNLRSADLRKMNVLINALRYAQLKVPYLFGGEYENDKAFDCSSFMQKIFGEAGVVLPRVSRDQAKLGVEVPAATLGDLVCIDRGGDGVVDHIGYALTDVLMIHIAGNPEGINVCDFTERYKGKVKTIRRVI